MSRHTLTIALAVLALGASALLARGTGQAQAAGAFASVPVFDVRGTALSVFLGGSVTDLEASAQQTGATGVWVQDSAGVYQLLVANGPAFLKAPFLAAFSKGVGATAVTLVRASGTAAPAATPTPAPSATPITVPAPNPTPSGGTATFATTAPSLLFDMTNARRASNGLGILKSNAQLTAAAAAYAGVVLQKDPYLGNVAGVHSLDGEPADRATRAGYQWSGIAENVITMSDALPHTGAELAPLMMDGWMNSAGHRANILNAAFVDTGVGCATGTSSNPVGGRPVVFICVALFGTPK